MKSNSDNFRMSAIQSIIDFLKQENIDIIIYEPSLNSDTFASCQVIHQLEEFKKKADIVVANRIDENIQDIQDKVYTRDLYTRD